MPLAFGISVAAGLSEANLISPILEEQWKAIALDVEITQKAPQQLAADLVQKHDFDVWVGQVSQNADPDFMTQLFHSANAKLGNINFTDYRNPRIDMLFDDARATTEEAKRKEMYREIQNILLDDLPFAPLVLPTDTLALRKRVQGVTYTRFADNGNRPWMKDVWVTDGQ